MKMLSGVGIIHYLQSLTPSLALGGELAYQRDNSGLHSLSEKIVSAVGRYTYGDSTISANIGNNAFCLLF